MNIWATVGLHIGRQAIYFICVLTTYAKAYRPNLYNNKPQAGTEFSAKLDVCRIQSFQFASFERC